MGTVVAAATMSLDGFVAHEDNTIEPLFEWFDSGDVRLETAHPELTFNVTPQSAQYWREWTSELGVLVVGRTLFDFVDGWGGRHPLDVPVVVLTHRAPEDWNPPGAESFSFVTEGIEAAIALAQQIAGSRSVGVAAGTIARQCLEAGLLDEVAIDLAPVVLGTGRPYFGALAGGAPIRLGDPTTVIRGDRVLHLRYPVLR